MKPVRYKQSASYLAFLFIFLLSGVYSFGQMQHSETSNIKDAVKNYYIKGLETRNFDLIESICIAEKNYMG